MVTERQNWEDLQLLVGKNTFQWEICELRKYVAKIRELSQNHRITEWSGLEGTSVGHPVQPLC